MANYTQKTAGSSQMRLKPKEDWVYTQVEPIVSDDLWSECNEILNQQERKQRRPAKKTVYLFSGVVHCECGKKMYPRELRTLGDHIRKRRLDLGLQQREVGEIIGVVKNTVMVWEGNRRPVSAKLMSKIIVFLGYDPLDSDSLLARALQRSSGLLSAGIRRDHRCRTGHRQVAYCKPLQRFRQSIAYKDYAGGWLLKRIGDFSCQSRVTPGVAWFNGDILLAGVWRSSTAQTDGGVAICYQGLGIVDVDMANFDDISMMANYGIARSIGTFVQMPSEKTTSGE